MLSFLRSCWQAFREARRVLREASPRRVRITQGTWKDEQGELLATYPNDAGTVAAYFYLVRLDNDLRAMAFMHDEVEVLPR